MGLLLAGLLWLLVAPGSMERAEIERRARELGMGYRSDFLIYDQEEGGKSSIPGEKRSDAPVPAVSGENRSPGIVRVEIRPGDGPEVIADRLAEAGLVDREEFLRRVASEGLSRRLRAGTYEVRPGEDVLAVITGQGREGR